MTEPWVGAWVWASGSQVWNGNIGTLMAKPTNMPPKISTWVDRARSPARLRSATPDATSTMENVSEPLTKNTAMKLTIISAEPNRVKRKNLMAAYWRFSPPHRSEEHTSELQSLMRISYAVFCLKKKIINQTLVQLKSTDLTTIY